MKETRGFTLLELLMVVIIIGILAAIALPQYAKVLERSRAAEAAVNLSTLRGAEVRYNAQNSKYTATLADLDVDAGVTTQWAFTLAVVGNTDAVATRSLGAYAGKQILVDFATGTLCGTDPVYGYPAPTLGVCP